MPVPKFASRGASPEATEGENRAPVAANNPFFLIHYPQNWAVETVGDKTVFVPVPQAVPVTPGLCGMRATKNKDEPAENRYLDALSDYERRGATVLRNVDEYRDSVDCRDPVTNRQGIFYFDKHADLVPPISKSKRLKVRMKRSERAEWLLSLVTRGVIAPPDESIVRELREKAEARVLRIQAERDLTPEIKSQLLKDAKADAKRIASAVVPEAK